MREEDNNKREVRDHHLENNTLTIGEMHKLVILRETSVGLFLGDEDDNEILLPNKYVPKEFKLDEEIDVYVYLDSGERRIATTIEPKIKRGEFGCLKCTATTKSGAFLDMGLEKDLFVPFKEQRNKMEEGRFYNVFMYLDEETDRLIGSNRLNRYLELEDVELDPNQEVDLLVDQRTDFGVNVIINSKYKGFVFNNQIFKPVIYGQKLKGFVKEVREDGKIDVTFQIQGIESIGENADVIIDALEANDGYLPLTDKSHPEEIRSKFGMSKKLFKKSIGALYKQKIIEIKDDGIYMTGFGEEAVESEENLGDDLD
ncbi:MAG: GntR family transcriptional regulator [Ichthyobacteriaceae bacterium]|nr:GntR family transcriptional regulator [Ichthyobacteriaceae bacterium]